MLSDNYIVERLEAKFPNMTSTVKEERYGLLTFVVDKEVIFSVIQFLKEDPELNFNFLTDLCGVHIPDQESKELGVIYHLHNLFLNKRIRIKTFFPIRNPHTPSITKLYAGANWMERETYDFFGILFDGHPNLKRILNVDEMNYFPMRKEYPLEDGTRTDKDDRFFGREGHIGREFDKRADRLQ
ncbi:MAG: NADH-quinone oxidoreductase subunit C [Saprospiraceae bacterium]|nr:NADH-quinone oxidoreductase subunit C [Saprospiraceae bacterium]